MSLCLSVFPCVCLFPRVPLSTCLSFRVSVCLSVSSPVSLCIFVYLSVSLSACLSVCLSLPPCPSALLSVFPCLCLSVSSPMSLCLLVCLFVSLSVCLSPPPCPSVYPSIFPCLCVSLSFFSFAVVLCSESPGSRLASSTPGRDHHNPASLIPKPRLRALAHSCFATVDSKRQAAIVKNITSFPRCVVGRGSQWFLQ